MRRIVSLLLVAAGLAGSFATLASEGQLKLANDADTTLVLARCAV